MYFEYPLGLWSVSVPFPKSILEELFFNSNIAFGGGTVFDGGGQFRKGCEISVRLRGDLLTAFSTIDCVAQPTENPEKLSSTTINSSCNILTF